MIEEADINGDGHVDQSEFVRIMLRTNLFWNNGLRVIVLPFWLGSALLKASISLSIFILDTGKQVLWQKVKTQMKCRSMRHFIRVCTVYKEKKSSDTGIHRNLEISTCDPLKYKMGNSMLILSKHENPSEWNGLQPSIFLKLALVNADLKLSSVGNSVDSDQLASEGTIYIIKIH